MPLPHEEQAARDLALSGLIEDVKALAGVVGHAVATIDRVETKTDDVLAQQQKMASHLLKIYQRQQREKEKVREHQQRIDRLENAVFPGARLQRPQTPVMGWAPRPPMPSADDSSVHDIAELQREIDRIKPEIEQRRRRESWFYRAARGAMFKIIVALAIAGGSAGLTYLLSHLR